MKIKIGTRSTQLALVQAGQVQSLLQRLNCDSILVPLKSEGDIMQQPLGENGGKGLFVKCLEQALVRGEIDCAVHSYKDMPFEENAHFLTEPVSTREDPRDVLVMSQKSFNPSNDQKSVVGTCSLRRAYQLKKLFPAMQTISIRGSVIKRLEKVRAGQVDGIVLAAAGLSRLKKSDVISYKFCFSDMVPAVGQGLLALQCLRGSHRISQVVQQASCYFLKKTVAVERAFLKKIEGSCHTPVGGYLHMNDGDSKGEFYGFLSSPLGEGSVWIKRTVFSDRNLASQGKEIAGFLKQAHEKKLEKLYEEKKKNLTFAASV